MKPNQYLFLMLTFVLSINLVDCACNSNSNEEPQIQKIDSVSASYKKLNNGYTAIKNKKPDTVLVFNPVDSINWIDSVRLVVKDSIILIPHDTLVIHLKDSLVYNYIDTTVYSYKDSIIIAYDERTFPEEIIEKYLNLFFNLSTKMLIIENTLPKMQVGLERRTNKKEYEYFICGLSIIMIYLSYKYDYMNYIDSIAINGYVDNYDKATGEKINPCILSINVSKNEFIKIDVEHVDSISCFNYLKGIKAPELSSLTPIAPLIVIDRSDKRIIDQRKIVGSLSNDLNIAAMDWQDFEHLVSELLEKEFHKNGGEVKVTQASHDGGVDAIAYNPDPILGGKIVIQAKRYTNIVGVSAVRDLYGTVMNEGASKGILVTTSDYGPDAYEFSKGKPLTLLNGSNLLHLLENHGYHAKIDLIEAKKIIADKNKGVI